MTEVLTITEASLYQFVGRMTPMLNERERRLFVGAVANMLGRGGLKRMNELTGMARGTILKGQTESLALPVDPKRYKVGNEPEPIRESGAGRKSVITSQPGILEAIRALLDGCVVGNPENPLCWTTKSTYTLATLLQQKGFRLSPNSVAKILKEDGFSLQQNRKYVEKGEHSPDRDGQFQFINERSRSFIEVGDPVISVDTKKKELVGNYKNSGQEYRPAKSPRRVNAHDFEGE